MKWALGDPSRFLHERSELDLLEAEVGWLSTAWRMSSAIDIEVDVDFFIHGKVYAGRLTYPSEFPNTPPYIRPRNSGERWTPHQYGAGGSLCLEWRADNWQQRITGADMVRSAYKLLATENNPEQPEMVPSAHQLTEGQSMRAENLRFVATPELLTILFNKEFQANTRLKPYKVVHGKTRILYIAEVGVGDTDWMEVTDLPAGITAYSPLFAFPSSGCALKSQNFSARREINSIDDLVLALNHAGFVAGDILLKPGDAAEYLQQQVFAYGSDASSLRVFDVKGGASPGLSEYKVIFPPVQNTRLPLEHEKLAKIRFGIVGLGSLGSKIAISLGRSGARQFLLVDDDFLTPGNVCRNELTWMSVGVHKVQAVKDTLTLIAPGMAIDIRMHRVAGQESTLEAAKTLRDLAACDVLIDATAIPDVFLLLASVARKNLKPLCWGELFAGGYGGIIARARPDLDPNPLAVRSALTDYFSKLPPAPYQNAGGYDVEQTQPLLAYDSDVGQIAAPLTRLAIDTALQNNPSQFPHPAYLIGLRKDWDFSEPFDVRPIDAIGAGWTEMTTPVDKDVLLSVTQELLKIIESSNDKPDPS